jgi:hypothetical protein
MKKRKVVQAISRTNTNDNLQCTHMYGWHARTNIITYTEALKNDPFAMPLSLQQINNNIKNISSHI